jgi:hypothetical protein
MPILSIPRGESLKGVAQTKENYEKAQAAEEMVRANIDAVFEFACRFIVMKSLPGWMDEICTEHLQAVDLASARDNARTHKRPKP